MRAVYLVDGAVAIRKGQHFSAEFDELFGSVLRHITRA